MKKFLAFLLFAAVLFGAASCGNEEISSSVADGDQVEVTFTAKLTNIGTRAFGEAEKITTLRYLVFDAVSKTPITRLGGVISADEGTTHFEVPMTLIKGVSYDILFWADSGNDIYSINETTGIVTVDYTNAVANDESRDAFFGVKRSFNVSNSDTDVTLRRPFAQLNVLTTDIAAAKDAAVVKIVSELTTTTYSTLNPFAGEGQTDVDGATEVTFSLSACPDLDGGYLSVNYLLVPATKRLIDVEYLFKGQYTENGEPFELATLNLTNIPVQRNYKTNISGSLLTDDTNFNVDIIHEFGGTDTTKVGVLIGDVCYKTLAEAYAAAQDGDELVVVGDITLAEQFVIEKNITLNLNSYKVTTTYNAETEKHLYAFNNKASLTIKGGAVVSRGIYNYGTLTLEQGAVIDACDTNGGYGIYNFGTFIMNGGEVKTSNEDDHLVDQGGYDATTIRNENGGIVTINGGIVNNISDYTFAIDNQAGGTVTINGGTITSIHSTISNYGTLTVNGGEFTCNGLEGVTAHVLVAWNNSTSTINGGVFDGKDNYNGFNVDAVAGATVYIKGGEFKAVHSGSLYGDGNIIVSGGVFFDQIADARLAEGCTIEQLNNGTWKVEGKGWYQDANGNYHIEGAKGWLWMADQNDTFFRSKTIYLDNDIDFAGVDMRVTRMWTPEYSATFDGQNHTISNIWMASNYSSNNQALFDGLMTVKNLNVDRASVFGMSQVGIIGANIYGIIDNCHVTNSRSYGYVHHVGGIVGLHSWGEIKNCSIESTSIECYHYGAVGAIAGAMNEESRNIIGCSVKGCSLIKEGPEGVYPDWDPCFGIAVGYAYKYGDYVFNVEVENNTIKGVASELMYGEVAAGSTVTINGVQQ